MANLNLNGNRPQTPEESIDLLQSLLAKQIPGWADSYTSYGDSRDKSQASILDSLLYEATGGHPPYVQLFGEDEWDDYVRKQSGSGHGVDPKGIRKWWGASAMTGKETRHSDPSEATPDTLRIRNLGNLIAEIPHALQYRDPNWLKPKEDYSWAFSSKDWEKKYTTPGEFEHEAHSIIQPLIEDRFFKENYNRLIYAHRLKYPENYRANLLEGEQQLRRLKKIADRKRKRLAKEEAEAPKKGEYRKLDRFITTARPDLIEEWKDAQLPRSGGGTQGPNLSDWLERSHPEFNIEEAWELFQQQKLQPRNTEESVPQGNATRIYHK